MLIKKEEECYFAQTNYVAYCKSCRRRFVVYEITYPGYTENCGESVRYCPFCGNGFDGGKKMNYEQTLYRVTVAYCNDYTDLYVIAKSQGDVTGRVNQYIKDTYFSPDKWSINAVVEIARWRDTDIYK